jgi:hypothetical protein
VPLPTSFVVKNGSNSRADAPAEYRFPYRELPLQCDSLESYSQSQSFSPYIDEDLFQLEHITEYSPIIVAQMQMYFDVADVKLRLDDES